MPLWLTWMTSPAAMRLTTASSSRRMCGSSAGGGHAISGRRQQAAGGGRRQTEGVAGCRMEARVALPLTQGPSGRPAARLSGPDGRHAIQPRSGRPAERGRVP